MLTESLILEAVKGADKIVLSQRAPDWFSTYAVAGSFPFTDMVHEATRDEDGLAEVVADFPRLADLVEKYRDKANWSVKMHKAGPRHYLPDSGLPVARTKVQARFARLLDDLDVWRGVSQYGRDSGHPEMRPLLGVDAAGHVVVIVMPMRD